MGPTSSSKNAIATAAATGQSWLPKNSSHSTRPIMRVLGPPRSEGMTNSPTAGMNTSMEPAITPGTDSGRVISRNDREAGAHDAQRLADEAQVQEHRVEEAVVADDAFERVDAQQEGGPERQHDDEQQQPLGRLR